MRFLASLQLLVALVSIAELSQQCDARAHKVHGRALLSWPPVLAYPFAYPSDVAASAQEADSTISRDAYAEKMCKLLADPKVQGDRRFSLNDASRIQPMVETVAQAAYGYSDIVVDVWAAVFIKCNSMGGVAAESIGFGVAYIYAEGRFEAVGLTKILERAHKSGGCKAISSIMDVAAAALAARQAPDALHTVMPTYSKVLQHCTPRDQEQKYKPGMVP